MNATPTHPLESSISTYQTSKASTSKPSILRTAEERDAALQICLDKLLSAQHLVITSHLNSDGDSIGSSLGLYHLVHRLAEHQNRTVSVRIIHPSSVPANFRFLEGSTAIEVFDNHHHNKALLQADVICVLDANAANRMKPMEELLHSSSAHTLVIDHHQDPKPFADVYAVDVESSSTCELIARLTMLAEERLNAGLCSKELAEAVYTGIMTDTGNFRFPRTDSELHRIIARLIEHGADPTYIYEQVMNQNSLVRSWLLGRALQDMRLYLDEKLCIMRVRSSDFQATGATEDEIEGFVEQTLSIRGVQMGALIVELPTSSPTVSTKGHTIKISLRSKGTVAVSQIAALFGGGGHLNAAGCRTTAYTLEEVEQRITEMAKPLLDSSV
jgi:phosphoesterase RecJ-like protein